MQKKDESGIIAYKVVDKHCRYGSNALGYIYNNGIDNFNLLLKIYPKLKKYCRQYKTGTVVREVRNSVGLMCFRTYNDARYFASIHFDFFLYSIIQVEGFGEKPSCYIIKYSMGLELLLQAEKEDWALQCLPPKGTLFFKKVKVLT